MATTAPTAVRGVIQQHGITTFVRLRQTCTDPLAGITSAGTVPVPHASRCHEAGMQWQGGRRRAKAMASARQHVQGKMYEEKKAGSTSAVICHHCGRKRTLHTRLLVCRRSQEHGRERHRNCAGTKLIVWKCGNRSNSQRLVLCGHGCECAVCWMLSNMNSPLSLPSPQAIKQRPT